MISQFQTWGPSNSTWASARLEVKDLLLLEFIRVEALCEIDGCGGQELANAGWTMAVLPLTDWCLLGAIAAMSRTSSRGSGSQNTANPAWRHAKPDTCSESLMQPLSLAE